MAVKKILFPKFAFSQKCVIFNIEAKSGFGPVGFQALAEAKSLLPGPSNCTALPQKKMKFGQKTVHFRSNL